jgi:hypothetical protein
MNKLIYSILSVKKDHEKLESLLVSMKGISKSDLYLISFDEISVVVSDVEKIGFTADKNSAIEYAGVIETLANQLTLLPMRFGSFMESNGAITSLLERNYSEISLNLQKVENMHEFGLKVFCDPETLKAGLKAKSEANTSATTSIDNESKNSVYKDWVIKKLAEHRLEELLLGFIDSVIATITKQLERLTTIHKFKKMATASILVDAVFLLEKNQKDDLIQTIDELEKIYPELNFLLTGPWPPDNFVEITLK